MVKCHPAAMAVKIPALSVRCVILEALQMDGTTYLRQKFHRFTAALQLKRNTGKIGCKLKMCTFTWNLYFA